VVDQPKVIQMTEGMCSTSRVLLETMCEAGVRYLFANLGSDHTGILEAYARAGRHGPPRNFPELVLCPHEGVAPTAARRTSAAPCTTPPGGGCPC
jgi:acetolactate synthase I/II/III large subunit